MTMSVSNDAMMIAIAANLQALNRLLSDASSRSDEACQLIQTGNRNGAMGAMTHLSILLNDAQALYRAVLALHRAAENSSSSCGSISALPEMRR
jgi:hypothetical protein